MALIPYNGPGPLVPSSQRLDSSKSDAAILNHILPMLMPDQRDPPPASSDEESIATVQQRVTISGTIDGSELPTGAILYRPERGTDAIAITVPIGSSTTIGTGTTQIGDLVANFVTQIPTQVFVGNQSKQFSIEPDLTQNFTIGRATHGMLSLVSNNRSTTTADLAGFVHAGSLNDYREVDFTNGSSLATLAQSQKDGLFNHYLSDGVVVVQGPDIARELGGLDDRYLSSFNDNGRITLQGPFASSTNGAAKQVYWLSDGTFYPQPTTGSINVSQGTFKPVIGEYSTLEYTFNIKMIHTAAPAPAINDAVTNDACYVHVEDYYTQYIADATTTPKTNVITHRQWYGPFCMAPALGSDTIYPAHVSVHHRCKNCFHAGENVSKLVGPPQALGSRSLSTYMGTAFYVLNVNQATSPGTLNASVDNIVVHTLNEFEPGSIGPTRIISWEGAENQKLSFVGAQWFEVVASNQSAAIINSRARLRNPGGSKLKMLYRAMFDGPSDDFKRVYKMSEYKQVIQTLKLAPLAVLARALKLSYSDAEQVAGLLQNAESAGILSEVLGALGGKLLGQTGGQIGRIVGHLGEQGLHSLLGTHAAGYSRQEYPPSEAAGYSRQLFPPDQRSSASGYPRQEMHSMGKRARYDDDMMSSVSARF